MKPEIIYLLIGTGGGITAYSNVKTMLESFGAMRHYKMIRAKLRENGSVRFVENGDRYRVLTMTIMRASYQKE